MLHLNTLFDFSTGEASLSLKYGLWKACEKVTRRRFICTSGLPIGWPRAGNPGSRKDYDGNVVRVLTDYLSQYYLQATCKIKRSQNISTAGITRKCSNSLPGTWTQKSTNLQKLPLAPNFPLNILWKWFFHIMLLVIIIKLSSPAWITVPKTVLSLVKKGRFLIYARYAVRCIVG